MKCLKIEFIDDRYKSSKAFMAFLDANLIKASNFQISGKIVIIKKPHRKLADLLANKPEIEKISLYTNA